MNKLKIGLTVEGVGKMRGELSYDSVKYVVKGTPIYVIGYLNNVINMNVDKMPSLQMYVSTDVLVKDILGRNPDDNILLTIIDGRMKYKKTGENRVWQFDGENFCDNGDITICGEDYVYESVIRVCNCLMAYGNISGHEELWEVYNYIVEHEEEVVDG